MSFVGRAVRLGVGLGLVGSLGLVGVAGATSADAAAYAKYSTSFGASYSVLGHKLSSMTGSTPKSAVRADMKEGLAIGNRFIGSLRGHRWAKSAAGPVKVLIADVARVDGDFKTGMVFTNLTSAWEKKFLADLHRLELQGAVVGAVVRK